jgi:hypothetical protein
VHDWTLECLNYEFNQERCGIAIRCVAANKVRRRLSEPGNDQWLIIFVVQREMAKRGEQFQGTKLMTL